MNVRSCPSSTQARRQVRFVARRPEHRARALAGAVILGMFSALPALLVAERPAIAQPADSVTQIARQRYNEGVKAYDAGRFEDARTAFLQAYALKRHPAVLLNLGQSELRSNHHDDACNHLQQFLREYTTATPDERAIAEKGIAEAKRKASIVVVSVDAAGADVSIDGVTIGKSPIYDPVFIKPGKHSVFAVLQGKSAAVAIDAKIGAASQATLTLGTPGAVAPAPVPMPPVPVPAPAGPPPGPPAGPPPGLTPVTPPAYQPYPPPNMMPPPVPPAPQGREDFFHWYKRKPIAWIGTGLTGAGLIMGIAGGAAGLSASSAANDVATQIRNHRATVDPNAPAAVCGDESTGVGVYPGYEKACSTLRDNLSLYHKDVAVTVAGWVMFGVGLAGTALYAMIDWYPVRGPAASADNGPRMSVVPIVSPTYNGVGLTGTF